MGLGNLKTCPPAVLKVCGLISTVDERTTWKSNRAKVAVIIITTFKYSLKSGVPIATSFLLSLRSSGSTLNPKPHGQWKSTPESGRGTHTPLRGRSGQPTTRRICRLDSSGQSANGNQREPQQISSPEARPSKQRWRRVPAKKMSS